MNKEQKIKLLKNIASGQEKMVSVPDFEKWSTEDLQLLHTLQGKHVFGPGINDFDRIELQALEHKYPKKRVFESEDQKYRIEDGLFATTQYWLRRHNHIGVIFLDRHTNTKRFFMHHREITEAEFKAVYNDLLPEEYSSHRHGTVEHAIKMASNWK